MHHNNDYTMSYVMICNINGFIIYYILKYFCDVHKKPSKKKNQNKILKLIKMTNHKFVNRRLSILQHVLINCVILMLMFYLVWFTMLIIATFRTAYYIIYMVSRNTIFQFSPPSHCYFVGIIVTLCLILSVSLACKDGLLKFFGDHDIVQTVVFMT